jgi:hypothetical protein
VTAPVIEAGVDTWRLLFKTRANGAEVAKLDRWSAHWIPALSLYCVEGHPSADGLCPGDGLANSYDEVSRALNAEVGSYESRGVSRRDTTATYRFGDGREGVAVAARNSATTASSSPTIFTRPSRCGGGVGWLVGLQRSLSQKALLFASGAYRDRTGDLRLAKPALSQLS